MLFYPDPVFSMSKRGIPIVTIGGYSYSKHVSSGFRSRWRCTESFKRKLKCRAILFVEKESEKTATFEVGKIEHNHPPISEERLKKLCKINRVQQPDSS